MTDNPRTDPEELVESNNIIAAVLAHVSAEGGILKVDVSGARAALAALKRTEEAPADVANVLAALTCIGELRGIQGKYLDVDWLVDGATEAAAAITRLSADLADARKLAERRILDAETSAVRDIREAMKPFRSLIDRIEGIFGWGCSLNDRGERLKDDPIYVAAYLAAHNERYANEAVSTEEARPRWCNTCGKRLETTSATATECATCEQWWRDNPPIDNPRTDPEELVERATDRLFAELEKRNLLYTDPYRAMLAESFRAALSALPDQEAMLKAERERCAAWHDEQAELQEFAPRLFHQKSAQAIRSLPPVNGGDR